MAATVKASRFALLTVDDDVDSDGGESKSKTAASKAAQQTASSKKKKNKKKKVEQQKAETDELRNLAFGKSGKGKGAAGKAHGSGDPPPQQWEQWKQRDSTFTSETYEQDLQQAMLLSKLDFEEHKDVKKVVGEQNGQSTPGGSGKEKKKKKKDKPAAMSLDQFNQMVKKEQQAPAAEDDDEWTLADESPSPKLVIAAQESDPKFFNRVEEDVNKILKKEKIQEEYRKQYVVESARSQQYQADIEKRDKEIAMLQKSSSKMQEELSQVKKRNQQLCHILAQGEMRDKRSVLLELEGLKQVRDELTQTVGELTTDLEKERSKVHALKAELDKVKPNQGGRNVGKN